MNYLTWAICMQILIEIGAIGIIPMDTRHTPFSPALYAHHSSLLNTEPVSRTTKANNRTVPGYLPGETIFRTGCTANHWWLRSDTEKDGCVFMSLLFCWKPGGRHSLLFPYSHVNHSIRTVKREEEEYTQRRHKSIGDFLDLRNMMHAYTLSSLLFLPVKIHHTGTQVMCVHCVCILIVSWL